MYNSLDRDSVCETIVSMWGFSPLYVNSSYEGNIQPLIG